MGNTDTQTLTGISLPISEEGKESWGTVNTQSKTYVEITLCRTVPGDDGAFYILAEWKLDGRQYALWGKVEEEKRGYADPASVAKAAMSIAENVTSIQMAE